MNACTQLLKNLGSFFYDAWRPITIHAPREGSDVRGYAPCLTAEISIHAPREGSDGCLALAQGMGPDISIHAPREGSDTYGTYILGARYNFYPRSPRGERQTGKGRVQVWSKFLSTLPARGATCYAPNVMIGRKLFLSTLPARGATHFSQVGEHGMIDFYPRSPRGERRIGLTGIWRSENFYPRSPRGERRSRAAHSSSSGKFLSTLPARGATLHHGDTAGDAQFLSTLPARGATRRSQRLSFRRGISIHAPREGSDLPCR